MKLSVPFFGAFSAARSDKVAKRKLSKSGSGGGGASFGSTSSTSDECASPAATTPRTVQLLPPSAKPKPPNPPPAVTRADLAAALRRVVPTEAEVALALAEAGLALEEAAAAEVADEADLRDTFAVFDADGDGRISAEELRAVLAELGDGGCSVDDCRRMIGGVDADGDGFVCFDEFARMMMHGL